MPPTVTPGCASDSRCIREAVCIDTKKIFDSCRDKDCIEDLRVFPSVASAPVFAAASCVRATSAELIHVSTTVKPITFNRGCYTIDVRYYYKITGEATTCSCRSIEFTGFAMFDKRVILFGSEGNAKVFSSAMPVCNVAASSLPTAIVEAVDPIVLNIKLVESCCCPRSCDCEHCDIPDYMAACFDSPISFEPMDRRVYITLGQFSMIRLERDTQLLIPTYDYCIPEKECPGIGDESDPCSLFAKINFPVDEFFPPNCVCTPEGRELRSVHSK
jgi:hypothetical protein